MAALQKIRSKGTLLIVVIGLALFAFIAEEFFRSIETSSNQSKQQIGEVYGENLSVQEYQALIDEYTEAVKFMRGVTSLDENEQNGLKDQVWQTYVSNKLIEHEAEKLGLTVTDAEVQYIINSGAHQLLMQTPFRNEQTGMFDATMLRNFLKEYETMQNQPDQVPAEYMEYYQNLYKYWGFIEKSLRESLLTEKFQVLLGKSFVSNPVAAKMAYENRITTNNTLVVAVPFTTVADKDVEVSDADLKAMYEKKKELFLVPEEHRVVKYVDYAVTPSEKDKEDLYKEMNELATQLREESDVARVVRQSNSTVNYAQVPVTKNALPMDIQNALDSVSVGVVTDPYLNMSDNSLNVIKLISKIQAPDSIQFRIIHAGGQGADKSADSIYNALKVGADFEEIAKKYNQDGQKQWMTSRGYETATMGEDDLKYIQTITNMPVNQIEKITLGQVQIIAQVTDRKAMTTKYDIAVIKRPIEFSKDTYSKAYNEFSRFVAANPTLKDMEANAAKSGYSVIESGEFPNSVHYVANIPGTREALRWVFDAKEGDVSQLYECGNNDHLMVAVVTKIYKSGYRSLEDVKGQLTTMVKNEKKAEKLMAQMKNIKDLNQAKAVTGAVADTMAVSMSGPAFVRATGSSEPALAGAVSVAAINQFAGPVKGNNGVFMYQVLSRKKNDKESFNEQSEELRLNQLSMRAASNYNFELLLKANVKDRRYLYF